MKIKFLNNYANIISKQGFFSELSWIKGCGWQWKSNQLGVCTDLKNDFQIHPKIALLWISIAIQVCIVQLSVTFDKVVF